MISLIEWLIKIPVKPEKVHFVTCQQGLELKAVVLQREGFLAYFCPKQGQDLKPSAAPLYPNMGQVPTPPPGLKTTWARASAGFFNLVQPYFFPKTKL